MGDCWQTAGSVRDTYGKVGFGAASGSDSDSIGGKQVSSYTQWTVEWRATGPRSSLGVPLGVIRLVGRGSHFAGVVECTPEIVIVTGHHPNQPADSLRRPLTLHTIPNSLVRRGSGLPDIRYTTSIFHYPPTSG